MSNPFDDIKEPRFNNFYVKGKARRMFSSNPDVHSYGTYENATLAFGATVDTGQTFSPENWDKFYSSNIGAVSVLGANRYWVVSRPSTNATSFVLEAVDVVTNTKSTLPRPGGSGGEDGPSSANGNIAPFIIGGKLYVVCQKYLSTPPESYRSKLYVLESGPTWTLVTDNILWPSGPGAVGGLNYGVMSATNIWPNMNDSYSYYPRNLNGLTQNEWWGIKVDAGSGGGFASYYDNPRLIKLSSAGALTDYTAITLREDMLHSGLIVTNDRIVMVTDRFTSPAEFRKQIFNVTAGVPSFVSDTQISTAGSPHTAAAEEVAFTTASDGYYTMSTTGTALNATLQFKKRTVAGITTITPTVPGIVNSQSNSGNGQFSLVSVSGWDLDSTKNGTALAVIPNDAAIIGTNASLDQSKFLLFNSDNTLAIHTIPGKLMTAALDPVSDRVYAVAAYNYGISNPSNNVFKLQYTTVA